MLTVAGGILLAVLAIVFCVLLARGAWAFLVLLAAPILLALMVLGSVAG